VTASGHSLQKGRFILLAPLGEGGQGQTWDAVDKREGHPVAIKRFDVRGARAWKDVELAEREAEVLATLEHPMLPRYVTHFEEDGTLYLVMEKIEGTSLAELRKTGPLPEADVVRLLSDADRVLGYLHGHAPPIVHRDLKPSNVIRRTDGSFAFVDFGAVRVAMRPEGGSTVVGTFGYMAPEQFQGRAGPGSDVYAIGATAIALLTGLEPEKLPHKGLAIDVERALRGRAQPRLIAALTKMLEPDPDARPTQIGPLLAGIRVEPGERREREREREPRAGSRPDWSEAARAGQAFGRVLRDQIEREIKGTIEDGARRAMRHADRHARRADKREKKAAARNEARRAWREGRERQREAERWAHGRAMRHADGRPALPWFVAVLFVLGLTIAHVAVGAALGVFVPAVLVFLSIFFGGGLRNAARAVRDAGVKARAAIDRARAATEASADFAAPRAIDAGAAGDAGDAADAAADPAADADHGIRVRVVEDDAARRRVEADRAAEVEAALDEEAEADAKAKRRR
jgi:hypothetical protein